MCLFHVDEGVVVGVGESDIVGVAMGVCVIVAVNGFECAPQWI